MRLIRVPGEGPPGAYLEVDLVGLDEEEDPDSFAIFLKLFSASTFLPGEDGCRPIEEIERESREHAERVSEDLKDAVFRAAESMISGLITDAVARGEIASPLELDEARLRAYRDAALLGLDRILFIFYAEARDPRLHEHSFYWKNYSATGLLEEILARPDRVWPENRSFLWERLRALFRIYDEGLPVISPWDHIPPRGGTSSAVPRPKGGSSTAPAFPTGKWRSSCWTLPPPRPAVELGGSGYRFESWTSRAWAPFTRGFWNMNPASPARSASKSGCRGGSTS
jgi:hypothetical protein